jgi:hypothetical protein
LVLSGKGNIQQEPVWQKPDRSLLITKEGFIAACFWHLLIFLGLFRDLLTLKIPVFPFIAFAYRLPFISIVSLVFSV